MREGFTVGGGLGIAARDARLKAWAGCISCSASISACEKPQWLWALSLARGMAGQRIEPNVVGCGASTRACEKGSQWVQALALLREMPARRLEPEVISCSTSFSGCEKDSQWAQALALL